MKMMMKTREEESFVIRNKPVRKTEEDTDVKLAEMDGTDASSH